MFTNILVAVDTSDCAQAALRCARELAQTTHGRLTILSVLDVARLVAVSGYATPYPVDVVDIMRADQTEVLKEAAAACVTDNVPYVTTTAEGDACEQILRVASAQHVDLIVLGTHGRTGLPRMFLGSVAEGVLRHAEVPVLIVRC